MIIKDALRMGFIREFRLVKFIYMTNEINKDSMDLATFIDADQQPERQKIFSGQPLTPAPVEGPVLLSENPVRIANMRHQESSQKVEPGKLFHGWIRSYELRKASNGSPYIRLECELEANNWRMSNTKFLPRNKIGSTEEIAFARDQILDKLGYDPASKEDTSKPAFPDVKLFEIGSWTSDDGKVHLNIKRIYNDVKDYNSFKQWEWDNRNKKKQWRAPAVELPE